MIRLRGEDSEDALREWAKRQLISISADAISLMRFLATTSLTTLAVFISLIRVKGPDMTAFQVGAAFSIVLSALVGLYGAIPRRVHLSGEQDLLELHNEHVRRAWKLAGLWLVTWILSIVSCVSSLFFQS